MKELEELLTLKDIVAGEHAWYLLSCNDCNHKSRIFTCNPGPTIKKYCAGCVRTNKQHTAILDPNQTPPQ